MIKYNETHDLAVIDGYSFRKDKRTGYFLSSRKINGARKRLHVYIWEREFGEIPSGHHVHHINGDKDNNDPGDLMLLSGTAHAKLHGEELTDEERQWRRENVVANGTPAAKDWHGSQEGSAWHSLHAKETMRKMEPVTYKCSYCGEEFQTKHRYGADQTHFCSNKCKSAYRRAQGADDTVKICKGCGKEYVANRYQKTKYCEDCKGRKGYPR